jgi:hypothetical protein
MGKRRKKNRYAKPATQPGAAAGGVKAGSASLITSYAAKSAGGSSGDISGSSRTPPTSTQRALAMSRYEGREARRKARNTKKYGKKNRYAR